MVIKSIFFILSLTFSMISFSTSQILEISNFTYVNDDLPEANQQVLDFVKKNLKKKVGTGECWDLAAEALKQANATWNGQYKFGKEINHKNEVVLPGDIIQLEGVVLNYEINGLKYTEKMMHHTAIIYSVKDKTSFEIAHQNNGFSGKKVGVSPLNLATLTKGKFKIYRPEK